MAKNVQREEAFFNYRPPSAGRSLVRNDDKVDDEDDDLLTDSAPLTIDELTSIIDSFIESIIRVV